LLIERYGQNPESMQDYRRVAELHIECCEKSGQSQKAKQVREWLDGWKSAQPKGVRP